MLRWLRSIVGRTGGPEDNRNGPENDRIYMESLATGERDGHAAGMAGKPCDLPTIGSPRDCSRREWNRRVGYRTGFAIGWAKGLAESSMAKTYVYQGDDAEGDR